MNKIFKNTFEKLGFYPLAILIMLIISACSSQKTSTSPSRVDNSQGNNPQTQSDTVSEPVTGLGLNVPPTRNFSIQTANTSTPEDILLEVDYGGFGGASPCDNYVGGLAVDQYTLTEADWLEPILISLCGVQAGVSVDAILQLPDGKTISDPMDIYGWYHPAIDSPTGKYRFTFSDGNVKVQFDVRVSMPNEPRMFYLENEKDYYLYGLSPNERIRFFQYNRYGMEATFIGWQEYYADKNGQLIIRPNQIEDVDYFSVGDVSGEIPSIFTADGRVITIGVLK